MTVVSAIPTPVAAVGAVGLVVPERLAPSATERSVDQESRVPSLVLQGSTPVVVAVVAETRPVLEPELVVPALVATAVIRTLRPAMVRQTPDQGAVEGDFARARMSAAVTVAPALSS
jgi:hypothetical protein